MALSANSVWEVRTAGADTNGGGFVSGAAGTDYSQQDAKNTVGADISTTDAVAVGTGVITSATANFGTTIVGNIIYLQGGTGALAAGWYQVTARASTTSITVDRNVAAGTGITMNIGGALATPGQMAGLMTVARMSGYIKAGTYSITSATPNISNGCMTPTTRTLVIGYNTTRAFGNTDTKPVIQTNVSTATQIGNTDAAFNNIDFDGNNATTSAHVNTNARFFNCVVRNFNTTSGTAHYFSCLLTGNSIANACQGAFLFTEAYANTATPIFASAYAVNVLTYDNTGASTDGITVQGPSSAINITAIGNGRDGIVIGNSGVIITAVNCVAQSNGRYGLRGDIDVILVNYASYNNTSGSTNGYVAASVNPEAYSADAFTDTANDNYALNNIASAGAALRAQGMAGLLATFPRGLTSGYLDIGAAQHADPASSGGYVPQVFE